MFGFLKGLLRFLRRMWRLPGFMIAFSRSPEGKRCKRGELHYKEALRLFNEREEREHQAEMSRLRKRHWAASTRLGLMDRKGKRLQADLDAATEELNRLSAERDDLVS